MKGKRCQGSGSQRTSCLYLAPPDACLLAWVPFIKQVNCSTIEALGRSVFVCVREGIYDFYIGLFFIYLRTSSGFVKRLEKSSSLGDYSLSSLGVFEGETVWDWQS